MKSLVTLCGEIIEEDLTPEALDEKVTAIGNKIDSYVLLDKACDVNIDFLKSEINHLKSQIEKFETLKERLRENASRALLLTGQKSMKSDKGHQFYSRTTKSVEVTYSELIPEQYMRKKVVFEPDKAAIKYDLEMGKEVPGATLVEKTSVVFK